MFYVPCKPLFPQKKGLPDTTDPKCYFNIFKIRPIFLTALPANSALHIP